MSVEDDPKYLAFMAEVEKRGREIRDEFVLKYCTGATAVEIGGAVYGSVRIVNSMVRNGLITNKMFNQQLEYLQEQMAAADKEKA